MYARPLILGGQRDFLMWQGFASEHGATQCKTLFHSTTNKSKYIIMKTILNLFRDGEKTPAQLVLITFSFILTNLFFLWIS